MADLQAEREREREKASIRDAVSAIVEYFIGDYSLKTIVVALFFGSYGLFQVARRMPTDWQTPQGYALLGMGFFGPIALVLFIVSGYRWCVRMNNRPTVLISGHAGWFEAGIRVSLTGSDAKVWLECQIVDNSGGYRNNPMPFTPAWTYEGDATIVRDQAHGTDAHLSDGKGASVTLGRVSTAATPPQPFPFFRQAMLPGADNAQPHAYLPLLIPAGDRWEPQADHCHVVYRVRAVATPRLREPCDQTVRVSFSRRDGFSIGVGPTPREVT